MFGSGCGSPVTESTAFEEQVRLEELENETLRARQKTRINALLFGLGFVLVVALILFRSFRQKHRANIALQQALTNLKTTKDQLVHAEKMASLGELTAGIAHEIQNPLNFVNNFAEVNLELIAEAEQEYEKRNHTEVKTILNDIRGNEQKISEHGKRADGIVKGMLQHSRSSKGQKEPTDINSLADEYLRLSYHGLRAKNKSFNADFRLFADESLPKINIVPQDIGRVLLNLISNSFYSVAEKAKLSGKDYKPAVIVSTMRLNGKIEIRVQDNGTGIPDNIREKIFQPFFTTKPTGSGTGLGLSLSYEIVKAHGGEIRLETREGEGTEFIVLLDSKDI